MSSDVLVVDYGVGNLLSLGRALQACGAQVEMSTNHARIIDADRIVLPGVGAFGSCMDALKRRELTGALETFIQNGKPLLGICVGMQMLMEHSEEFGDHQGLGIIPGRVAQIPDTGSDGTPHKIPHIGWSGLFPHTDGTPWDDSILAGISPQSCCYFVHGYTAEPKSTIHILAECDYDGRRLCAAVRSGNVTGTQFHPEKSGEIGLKILTNFLELPASLRFQDREYT